MGLVAAYPALSKVCVVGLSKKLGIDVDYTFAQVGILDGEVDYRRNCGNMSSAVGPFAIDAGLVNETTVMTGPSNLATARIYNTDTDKIIHSTFAVEDGNAIVSGSFAIDGVAGTGSPIQLQFMDHAGTQTGKLLSTGSSPTS